MFHRKREKGKGKKEQKSNGEPNSPVSEEPESVDRNLFGDAGMAPPSAGFSVSFQCIVKQFIPKRIHLSHIQRQGWANYAHAFM